MFSNDNYQNITGAVPGCLLTNGQCFRDIMFHVICKCFILSLLLVLLIQKPNVEGARCRSSLGWGSATCRPCGRGTRCLFCTWCTGFCNNRPKSTRRKREENDGLVEVLYKIPFLEMFKDLDALLSISAITDLGKDSISILSLDLWSSYIYIQILYCYSFFKLFDLPYY